MTHGARRGLGVFAAGAALWIAAAPVCACSTFCFDGADGPVFGKNYDWNVEVGMLVVNRRGVYKVALPSEHPAAWTSRYGSVTFNQYGREMPSGGMNERGLVVELMWLDEARYPAPDRRPAVTTLQWIQYQLDNCATVAEVIASDADIRIIANGTPLHFLVADAGGNCAAVEFIDGRLVAHTGASLPFRTLTNSTYDESSAYARSAAGRDRQPQGTGSLERFARAAAMCARAGAGEPAVDRAFAILDDVAQGDFTKWSLVYDIGAARVYFRTLHAPAVRWLDLGACDFDCASPAQTVDMSAAYAGDLAPRLVPYTAAANRALISAAFAQTDFLRDTPRDALERLVRYPEQTTCGD